VALESTNPRFCEGICWEKSRKDSVFVIHISWDDLGSSERKGKEERYLQQDPEWQCQDPPREPKTLARAL
jgi:hypothetical protein